MNKLHLEYCASDEWAGRVHRHVIPWVVEGLDLGDDVLEVGPGPGRTTEKLRELARRLTAVELDHELAEALRQRLGGPNLEVVEADATALPLPAGRFSAALSFTMLHHVPTPEMQDQVFAELARVLRSGGVLAAVDSLDSEAFREMHVDDICNPLDPATLPARLEKAGFSEVRIALNDFNQVRFQAFVAAP
jgi:ubiquinone/menaquinone biosynthesis C-methylase UbiE